MDRGKHTLLLAGQCLQGFRRLSPPSGLGDQSLILGDTDNVFHLLALTPAKNRPATETTVSAEYNLHLGPVLAEGFDEQREDSSGVPGRITIAAEIRFNLSTFYGWKFEGSLVAFCLGGNSCWLGANTLIFKRFPLFFYPFREIIRASRIGALRRFYKQAITDSVDAETTIE